MKHIKLLRQFGLRPRILSVALLLFTAFNFTSCTQDLEPVDPAIVIPGPTDPDPTNPTPGTFEADITGVSHFSSTNTVVYISANNITITAIRPQGDSFGFILAGTTTGTYAGNDFDNLIGYNAVGVEDTFAAWNFDDPEEDTGSVIVTEINQANHTISGTFQFKGYSEDNDGNTISKQITNGVFTNLPYTTTIPTGDTFFAKVNGVEFEETDLLGGTVAGGEQEFIFVSATTPEDETITVNILSTLGVGTYSVTSPGVSDVQIIYTLPDDDFGTSATSGTVTVTEKTATRIKGTFSTTITVGATAYVISEGAFDVEYED